MSDTSAYAQGFWDARDYDACNPDNYGFTEESENQSYVEGYGDGMDVNISFEKGVSQQQPKPQTVLIAQMPQR